MTFDIEPFVGAHPVRFDMTSEQIQTILGQPGRVRPLPNGQGTSAEFKSVNVRFDPAGRITDLSIFGPLPYLQLNGRDIWSASERLDPNRVLLASDPEPVDVFGFWTYQRLGVAVTGYQDDDPGQEAVTILSAAALESMLGLCEPRLAVTTRYAGLIVS